MMAMLVGIVLDEEMLGREGRLQLLFNSPFNLHRFSQLGTIS
jgi:hypothetical protein